MSEPEIRVPTTQEDNCIELILSYFNLMLYMKEMDPRVRKLSVVTKAMQRVGLTATKDTTVSMDYCLTLQKLLEPLIQLLLSNTIGTVKTRYLTSLPYQHAIVDSGYLQAMFNTKERHYQHFTDDVFKIIQPMIERSYKDIVMKNTPASPTLLNFVLNLRKWCPPIQHQKFTISLVGCHGLDATPVAREIVDKIQQNADAQFGVANEMRKSDSDIVIQLGDNAYFHGIGNMADDEKNDFFTRNQQNYGRGDNLYNKPSIAVVGNHDCDFYGSYGFTERLNPDLVDKTCMQRVLSQVLHTYHTSDHWNMPYRYYMLVHDFFILVVLDTNMFVIDPTQQKWFVETLSALKKQYPDHWVIVAGHHPLVYLGKRADKDCEWANYPENMNKDFTGTSKPFEPSIYSAKVKKSMPISSSKKGERHPLNNVGEFLLAFIDANHDILPTIDIWLAAHEHFMTVVEMVLKNNRVIKQITSGAGGAKLSKIYQNISNPIEPKKGAYIKTLRSPFAALLHGYIDLQITPTGISFKPIALSRGGEVPDCDAEDAESAKCPQYWGIELRNKYSVLFNR
ncbi:MAG: hypothetical protein EXR81_03315 [Gammaproteobacteria bacterium]|nr:hypothetical protein [Gammaproteobacteria bacterium]